jgi:ABC-2 type transport system ATP-binding protein
MAAIKVENLCVRRGGKEVVHDVSFMVPRGSVTGLLGPSGCGKTTLMRAIVGVQIISGGSVTVLGQRAGSKVLRTKIGYCTQDPAIYRDLTVRQALRYFAAVLGVHWTDIDRVIDDVDLRDCANQLVGNLSGGQLSRANLAVALLGTPEILILDEPTVGLDPVLRNDLWALFHELAHVGTTVLVSSHVMDEAGRCERLLLMREGELLADDTPDEIRVRTGTADLEQAFIHLIQEGAPT